MSVETDPMMVLGREDFSLSDPRCALEFFAACAAAGRDVSEFPIDPVFKGRLSVESLREYGEVELELAVMLHSRCDATEWMETREVFALARSGLSRCVELGLAEAACVAELEALIASASAVVVQVVRDPADEDESAAAERWLDPGPELPLRAARYRLEDLIERSLEGSFEPSNCGAAIECVALLRGAEIGMLFERSSRNTELGTEGDPGQTETLLDALAIRELAGELYALTGDEALLREIERVDTALNAPERINALFAVSASRWWTDHDRAPSPKHWWGVRTHAEENAPALLGGIGSSAAQPPPPPPKSPPLPPPDSDRRLEDIIAAASARYAAEQHAKRKFPVPVAATGSAASSLVPAPLVWRSAEHDWFVSLKFGAIDTLTDDTLLSVIVIDPPSAATRLHVAGQTLKLLASDDVLLASIRYGDFRQGGYVEVVALDVGGDWQVAPLDDA
jgi:hypothetical protein